MWFFSAEKVLFNTYFIDHQNKWIFYVGIFFLNFCISDRIDTPTKKKITNVKIDIYAFVCVSGVKSINTSITHL